MKKVFPSPATALVTGGSSGMGLEFARQLAARGYAPVLVSNRAADLAAAKTALEASFPVPVRTFCCDLALPGAGARVLDWCDAEGITPSVLVNDAGMFFMKYLEPEDLPRVHAMMALHMDAVTDLCLLFGGRMKAAGGGRILNVASMAARIPAPGITVYSASKAYLKSFGKSLSHEFRPFGVTVTTVCPAAVDTGLYPLGPRLRKWGRRIGLIRSPEWLVRRALRGLFRGRRMVSPGLVNALVPPLIALLPDRLIDRIGRRWVYRK